MSGRLKRRSSVGFPIRREEVTEENDVVVDEEAERRARNLQRKQRYLDSPASSSQEKAASRRSINGISGLTTTQLAEHYNNCIKLSAENKISTKNAFNLQLIDYMAAMIRKKESDMSNFQVAAGTLDASTKIYAYRVDAVYGDTLKIASGLGQSRLQEDDKKKGAADVEDATEEDLMDGNNPKKVRKRLKRSNTIEKNLKNLNVNKFELEFDVDPLFKKTSSQFDGAFGGNQFLATLEVMDESGELLLDSESKLSSDQGEDNRCAAGVVEIPRLPNLNSLQICPTFSQFSFDWSLDSDDFEYNRLNESISASQEGRSRGMDDFQKENLEHAFDTMAIPEPVEDCGVYDEGGVDGDCDDDLNDYTERAVGHAGAAGIRGLTANLPMSTTDMLSALTTAPHEYSYFDHGKLGAWAGPKHWKFKPMARPTVSVDKKIRKKKEILAINVKQYACNEEEQDRVESLLSKPKKLIRLAEKTMKGWSREKNILPEDIHYSGRQLVTLKTCDQIAVVGCKSTAETQVDDVDDYNYDNPADKDDYCPDVDDDQDAYGGGDSISGQDTAFDASLNGATQSTATLPSTQDEYAGEMVEAPKMVDKSALLIGYAKTAKKVDMKRIKSVTWNILTQASNEDKENVGGSPEKVNDKEGDNEMEEMSFTQVYKQLKQPHRLPPKMCENLSVPLALLAMLHLCNERSLELQQDPSLSDFIVKGGFKSTD